MERVSKFRREKWKVNMKLKRSEVYMLFVEKVTVHRIVWLCLTLELGYMVS